MERPEPKKLALIRIMQISQKYSDYDHPLKQEDIAGYLDEQDFTENTAWIKSFIKRGHIKQAPIS